MVTDGHQVEIPGAGRRLYRVTLLADTPCTPHRVFRTVELNPRKVLLQARGEHTTGDDGGCLDDGRAEMEAALMTGDDGRTEMEAALTMGDGGRAETEAALTTGDDGRAETEAALMTDERRRRLP